MPSPQDRPAKRTMIWATVVGMGGLAIAVAPFLPWLTATSVTLGSASSTGNEVGRGSAIAVAAGIATIVAGMLLFLDVRWRRFALQLAAMAAIVAGIVAWVAYGDAANPALSLLASRDETPIDYRPGVGVWLLIVGCAITLVGTVGAAASSRPSPTSPRMSR
jgi:hypothetical protein